MTTITWGTESSCSLGTSWKLNICLAVIGWFWWGWMMFNEFSYLSFSPGNLRMSVHWEQSVTLLNFLAHIQNSSYHVLIRFSLTCSKPRAAGRVFKHTHTHTHSHSCFISVKQLFLFQSGRIWLKAQLVTAWHSSCSFWALLILVAGIGQGSGA